MSLRFVIGRAGTGKTYRCVQAIRDRLAADPVDGPHLIFLVPEQAALQMERAIVAPDDRSPATVERGLEDLNAFPSAMGAHRARVVSFRRLAFLVLDASGSADPRALSDSARAMVLRHLLTANVRNLRYYRGAARWPGLFERVGAAIAEFIEEGIEPEDVRDLSKAAADPASAAKFHDLHLLYANYLRYLGTRRLDPSQFLQVARPHIDHCAFLKGAHIWIDGFASFSLEETRTLVALARAASRVEITAMLDPSLAESGPVERNDEFARLFLRTRRTLERLTRVFHREGISIEEPLTLTGDPPRFRGNATLARMEKRIFSGKSVTAVDSVGGVSAVELIALPSRRLEVEYAVYRLVQWLSETDRHFRFRDLAIIARDLEPYHDLLTDGLRSRRIPFFLDRKRPMAHHPLVELLRCTVTLSAEDMSLESVRVVLKTGMLPFSDAAADELENYILAHGLSGVETWQQEWAWIPRCSFLSEEVEPVTSEREHLRRINGLRCSLVSAFGPWFHFVRAAPKHGGHVWAGEILRVLEHLGVGETLARWARIAEQAGELNEAEEHRQVWRDMLAFLDDLTFAFADTTLSLDEFRAILETGLSSLSLELAPPTVDQVLVSSIDRSRHPDIRAAVILGFNDSLFPRSCSEDTILNDDDRSALAAAGFDVRPPSRTVMSEERLLAYTAFTRASESLVVTWSTSDPEGKPLRPSPFVDAVIAALPETTIRTVRDPIGPRDTWPVLGAEDLFRSLPAEFASRPPRVRDDPIARGRWNSLYELARNRFQTDELFFHAMRSLEPSFEGRLSSASVERLYPGPVFTSVSRLESFAACPFQHFARHVLRLRPRDEARVEAVDLGQWHHAVLEDVLRSVADREGAWRDLSDAELDQRLEESLARVSERLPATGSMVHARDAYVLRRSRDNLLRTLRAQRRAGLAGRTVPKGVEIPFGFNDPGSLPPLAIETPEGRRIHLRGYIDRVDLAELGERFLGIVIDYKQSGRKRLRIQDIHHGLSLQLVAYLLVLAEHGAMLGGRPVRPIAAFYVGLAPTLALVAHPSEIETSAETVETPGAKLRGIVRSECVSAIERNAQAGWSESFNLYHNKDGGLGNLEKSDAVESEVFEQILDRARRSLGRIADSLLDGDVSVHPCRLRDFNPCTWCEMRPVCRFEWGLNRVRFLETLSRSQVLSKSLKPQSE